MQRTETGESILRESGEGDTGEPDALKGACPVRRGADGKGPGDTGTSPAAYPTCVALEECEIPTTGRKGS
jgi:hypothetical protein